MSDIIDIRQDHSRPSTPDEDEVPTKRLKNSRKKKKLDMELF